jgi:hypothetical protein
LLNRLKVYSFTFYRILSFLVRFLMKVSAVPTSVNVLRDMLNDSSRLVMDSVREHHMDLGDISNGAYFSFIFFPLFVL